LQAEQNSPGNVFSDDAASNSSAFPADAAEARLRDWIREFEAPLLRYAARILGPDTGDPEDVVQQTFIRCFEFMVQNGPDSIRNPASWLFRVAHNLARDVGRQRRRRRILHETAETDPAFPRPSTLRPVNGTLAKETYEVVLRELDRLPERDRVILTLKFDQGLTLRDICEVTGMKLSTVHYHLRRGLDQLAVRLRELGIVDGSGNGT